MIFLSQDFPQYLIGGTIGSFSSEFIDCERGQITTNGDRLFAVIPDPKDQGLRMQLKNIKGSSIRNLGAGNSIQYAIPLPEEGTPEWEAKKASVVESLFHVMKPKPAA
jgi:hypothetical protein